MRFRISMLQLETLDDAAAAKHEHLHDRASGAALDAENVAMVETGRRHLLLALADRVDRADGIAQLRGFFVALAARRLRHPLAQLTGELVVAALEEQSGVGDGDGVAFLRAD